MRRVGVIQAGVLILPLLGPACAVEPLAPPPTSDEALMAKYPVAVAGTVTMVTLQPGKLGFHGFQGGTMTVTLTVSAVDKGPLAVGESLTFTGSTVLRPADLEGPISAIPPTLKMGDRVHVYLDRQQDGLVVPYWAAFRLVDKAARRFWVVVGLDGWSGFLDFLGSS